MHPEVRKSLAVVFAIMIVVFGGMAVYYSGIKVDALVAVFLGIAFGSIAPTIFWGFRKEKSPRKENESDQEKPLSSERSEGTLSMPLSGFELITDKITYNVGDTIRATVKVLSLALGTTTVRLIAPSGQQPISKNTGFHLSGTFNFELAVVEQSWEKGVWRVIAQQGTMSAEQKIEIL